MKNILLIFRVTQFAAVLYAGFLVSCDNFMNFYSLINYLGQVFRISTIKLYFFVSNSRSSTYNKNIKKNAN
jgi:hypothetical protein